MTFRSSFATAAATGFDEMPGYMDSSVLLSLLLGDAHAERARRWWHGETDRVSSILLGVECATVLRRVPGAQLSAADRRDVEQRLAFALEEVTLKPVDEDIAAIVGETTALGRCRTLDAIHLATALFFRDAADTELQIYTFDARMSEVASRVGLRVG